LIRKTGACDVGLNGTAIVAMIALLKKKRFNIRTLLAIDHARFEGTVERA
jgi:hypothetical protein